MCYSNGITIRRKNESSKIIVILVPQRKIIILIKIQFMMSK